MNVYEKLQEVRVELQNMNLKKSGKNTFSKYEYFELSDFLPSINQLCKKYKLSTVTTFNEDFAALEVINVEAPEEKIIFTSPMAKAELKGCHEIQNVGAVETYQRRYLMMLAFEIVESDTLDAVTGSDNKATPKQRELSDAQLTALYELGKQAGYSIQDVDKHIKNKFKIKTQDMSKSHYEVMVNGYKEIIAKKEGK